MTALGAMRASIPGLASEIGWTTKAFAEAFAEACSKGMAEHDESASIIWLPNFLKYNPPESPNVVKAWVASLDLIPESDLKDKAIQSAKAFAEGLSEAFVKAIPKAFVKALPKAMPNQEQEQEQEQEKDISASASAEAPQQSDPIPYKSIVELYHGAMSNLAKVRELTPARKTAIRSAWQASQNRRSLDFWKAYFEECADDRFLNGTGPYLNGHENWRPTFDYLLKPKTVTSVYEKAMDRLERAAA